jgi:hypothetical protein
MPKAFLNSDWMANVFKRSYDSPGLDAAGSNDANYSDQGEPDRILTSSEADAPMPDQGTTTSQATLGTVAQLANYLVNGFWQGQNPTALPHHWASTTITYNIDALTSDEQLLAQSALNAWHEVANLTFVQSHGVANITYNHNGAGMVASTGATWNSSGNMTSATVDISTMWIATDGGANDGKTGIDSYGYQTYLHETGHALGLGHQGPYNGNAVYGVDNVFTDDTWQYSLMSYFAQDNYNGGSYRYVVTPQLADITATDSMYGAAITRTGNTIYGFNSTAGTIFDFSLYTTAPALTIYDSGGIDTLNCSGYSSNQTIDLTSGNFCSIGGLVHNIGIFTTAVIENAVGGSGNDTIIGNGANNIIDSGIGSDTVDGGGGWDTATLTSLFGAATIVKNSDGSWTITSAGKVERLTDVEIAKFSDRVVSLRETTRDDFNSDGTSDVLWRNDATGHVGIWTITNNTAAWHDLGGSGTDHKVVGVGDFNGDGTSDVFWRNDATGHVGIWTMTNNNDTWIDLGGSGVDHKVVGIGDFNGDGTADVLWRNDATGHVGIWTMNNNVNTWHDLGGSGVDHKVVGIGDFNGDGTSDILWRNDATGHVGIWTMNNNVNTWHDLGGSGTDHKVVGIGDFNGDGTSDILWRNDTTGHVGIWTMTNNINAWHDLGGSGTDHKVVGIGDFNNDGTSDVFWRNDATGHVGIWTMNNNTSTWHDLGGSETDLKAVG